MIYISTACIHTNKIDEAVLTIAKRGGKYIELSGGTQYYEGYLQDLLSLQKRYNLQYTSHGYFPPPITDIVINLASCDEEIYIKSIKFYLNAIAILKKLGGKVLSVHAGFYIDVAPEEIGKKISLTKVYDKELANVRFCEAIRRIKREAEKSGIFLLIENNVLSHENFVNFQNQNLFMMTDSASINEMRKYLKFDLLLDVGHLKVSAKTLGLDFATEFGALIPPAKWLHLHDNNGEIDQHQEITEDGWICKFLKESSHHIPENVTIEVHSETEKLFDSYDIVKKLKILGLQELSKIR